MKRSRFAPAVEITMPVVAGVSGATMAAGIKYRDRDDLLLMTFVPGTVAAGVFTRSRCASAPVDWCRKILGAGTARALVVNAGNANAFTGMRGADAVTATVEAAAEACGIGAEEIFVASTGVIGEPMNTSAFASHLRHLAGQQTADVWQNAAAAIMTTDTFAKMASRNLELGGRRITINGIGKGSGMIAPDMATMLAFVATDAPVDASALQRWLAAGTKVSFNAITVDSDTSTSDTLMAFATGEAGGPPLTDDPADHDGAQFADALADLLFDLAMQTVKDGEGLTKFVRIEVTGAENEQAADAIARAIADSPLVKTAIAGEDPNWGRIVMAVGKAGERADRDALAIRFGDIEVAKRGEVSPTYREVDGAAYMKRDEIDIHVDVGIGTGAAVVYTCDLTHDYIAINADYRS